MSSISLPRSDGPATASRGGLRMPRFFRRLFKFPQMDFELAVWEMTNLLIAPKKVFRSMYHHKQTKNTFHRGDPSFTYLLCLFMLLTALAWGIAYTSSVGATVRLAFIFAFLHCILTSLVVATASFFFVAKVLAPGIKGLPSLRRRQGLFPQRVGGDGHGTEAIEYGYCFDVAIRAFFPVWVVLYVLQFLFWPIIARSNWAATFLGNTLYLVAFVYYTVITFLGYNALPSLHHTELFLMPVLLYVTLWLISLFGFNIPRHVTMMLLVGAR